MHSRNGFETDHKDEGEFGSLVMISFQQVESEKTLGYLQGGIMIGALLRKLVESRQTALLAVFAIIAAFCSAGTAAAQVIGIRSNPPYSIIENGVRDGVVLKPALAALSKIGISGTPTEMPAQRFYRDVEEGTLDIGIDATPTQARERGSWFSEPIFTDYVVIFVPKDKTFPFETIKDLTGKKLGGRLGFSYGLLDQNPEIVIERVNTQEQNVDKLLAGRLDGIIANYVAGELDFIARNSLDKVAVLPVAVNKVPLAMTLSRKRYTEQDLVRLNSALGQLRADPDFRKLLSSIPNMPAERRVVSK